MTDMRFDESRVVPKLVRRSTISSCKNTSSIDTSSIDPYRQGVEITLSTHRNLGTVKIGTGESDNCLRQATFGCSNGPTTETHFSDSERAVGGDGPWASDGVIEALTIRSVITFETLDGHDDGHGFHGALMSGTEDAYGGSAIIETTYVFDPSAVGTGAYVDVADTFGGIRLEHGMLASPAHVKSMNDAQNKSGVRIPLHADAPIVSALLAMNPATDDGMIPDGHMSMTAGYVYDFTLGSCTDSLAFGGLGH